MYSGRGRDGVRSWRDMASAAYVQGRLVFILDDAGFDSRLFLVGILGSNVVED